MDTEKALKAALDAAQQSRQLLLSYFGRLSNVSEKEMAGLVSEADVESEKKCGQILKSYFPDFGMLGEEGTDSDISESALKQGGGLWIVDPLDGTSNYVHKFPIYCISIALQWNGQIVVGVIDIPFFQRTYWAVKDRGAYLNDDRTGLKNKKIFVSERSTLSTALLATGFNSYDVDGIDDQLKIFSFLVKKTRGVRRAGSAAFDLCMVAEGVFDAYWEKNLKPWDMAAGALLVSEAGGSVTDFSNAPYVSTAQSIVAGNRFIHKEVQPHCGMVLSKNS